MQQFKDEILIYPPGVDEDFDASNTDGIFMVGIPFDLQLDPFYISEFGSSDATKPLPEWIKFVNETITEDGVRFKLTPTDDDIGEYDAYFNLAWLNPEGLI